MLFRNSAGNGGIRWFVSEKSFCFCPNSLVSVTDKESSLYYDTLSTSVTRDSAFNSISENENSEDEGSCFIVIIISICFPD